MIVKAGKKIVSKLLGKSNEAYLQRYLTSDKVLRHIERADTLSDSVGVSSGDYALLYHSVMRLKPKYVLECGTGRSTLVIAQALKDLVEEGSIQDPVLVSMEQSEKWHQEAKAKFPFGEYPFVQIHCSPMSTHQYAFISGSCFESVPDYPYDFVFVDGPYQDGPPGQTACNVDFIRVVQASEKPVWAVVDNRKSTVLAYTLLFGQEKVSFFTAGKTSMGLIRGVTRNDLILGDKGRMKKGIFWKVVSRLQADPIDWLMRP